MAGMTGAQAVLRRPLLAGAAAAFLASIATWGIAQTVLGSLSRYGEKLEALVSLVAIGVLLLILNWFYHRVYWKEHLAELHGRKKKILGIGLGASAASLIGLGMLGFSSVYREGFETVLFLQAIVLEAGAGMVLVGVAIGLAATLAVGLLTIRLQRRLPHKKMLMATGLLILWVLVVMVGTTVQTLQVVGWVPVTPVEGMQLPYWAGLWLGIYPTWEGLLAQGAATAFVLGSYVAAEQLRKRKRRAILEKPAPVTPS
jgi:high-affinity iron transporter